MSVRATALIADDEPLLREALVRLLGSAWRSSGSSSAMSAVTFMSQPRGAAC